MKSWYRMESRQVEARDVPQPGEVVGQKEKQHPEDSWTDGVLVWNEPGSRLCLRTRMKL